jgi:DNA-binding CsgD family transcriptional regulator
MRSVESAEIEKIGRRIGDAALDPGLWPAIMEEICHAAGATGSALLQADVRTPDIPRTASVDELFSAYFHDQWHTRDIRVRGAALLARGEPVITDQDVVTPEEMNREAFYNECLYANGFKWFAGVGFLAGSALWALSIQRTAQQGPFEEEDKRLLALLSPKLGEAATLSTAVGRTVVSGVTNALDLVRQPALILDRNGFVLDANALAEKAFGEEFYVKNRRVTLRNPQARADFERLIDQLRTTGDAELSLEPIVIRCERAPPILIRILPLPLSARGPFLGARVLLTLTSLTPKPAPSPTVVSRLFGLTLAEAKLASIIATGVSPGAAADRLGVSRDTARNQLKAVFAKTETHRQSELVALLSQLAG